jgi:hypothetical protein
VLPETISAYLRGAGAEIWPPGRWKREGKAKPAIEVITGSDAAKPAIPGFAGLLRPSPNPENLSPKGKAKASPKPAIEVITGFGVGLSGYSLEDQVQGHLDLARAAYGFVDYAQAGGRIVERLTLHREVIVELVLRNIVDGDVEARGVG